MRGAIQAGATVVETDIQVSKDNVVVICHDPSTLRCFGALHKVANTNFYGELDQLRTIQAPHEPMPTFKQVAELFANDPEFAKARLMLDVKRDNEPWVVEDVVEVLREVRDDMEFWATRMVFGIWRYDVLKSCEAAAPQIPLIHIGLSRSLAMRFLAHDQVVGISMHHLTLKCPGAQSLILHARKLNKLVYGWTINNLSTMQWAMAQNLDGIVTDNPDVYSKLVANLTDADLAAYAKTAPTAFFSYLELLVLFPWVYLRVRLILLWHLLNEYLTPPRQKHKNS